MSELGGRAKRGWQKPQMTVLVRNKPEETVLTACKLDVTGSTGDSNWDNRCMQNQADCGCCFNCQSS